MKTLFVLAKTLFVLAVNNYLNTLEIEDRLLNHIYYH